MNKKDFAALRKQFKLDSVYLKLEQLYMVYINKDNLKAVHAELTSPDMKDEDEKEIYLDNFKKLLTGSINSKLFELSFDREEQENEGQALCLGLLNSDGETFAENCDRLIEAMTESFDYDCDVVISFLKCKYNKPAGKKSRGGEEEPLGGFDETTYGFRFIMCSVNKADSAKRSIYYDYSSKRLEMSSSLNKTIGFPSPIDGFMFPAFSDNCADVNNVIYYTSKANLRNEALLSDVLRCGFEPTAKEEQEKFEELIREVNGEKIKPLIIRDIYAVINEKLETQEETDIPVKLGVHELRDIFSECGVQNLEKLEETFCRKAEDGFEFRADSVVPSGTKSIKITAGAADISIDPQELGTVRQVIDSRGRKCLQIELGEDAAIGGFILETEHF